MTEMRPCSEQEMFAEEVLVWPEVVLLSTEPEAKEVDPVDKRKQQEACLDDECKKERGYKFHVNRALGLYICRFG